MPPAAPAAPVPAPSAAVIAFLISEGLRDEAGNVLERDRSQATKLAPHEADLRELVASGATINLMRKFLKSRGLTYSSGGLHRWLTRRGISTVRARPAKDADK